MFLLRAPTARFSRKTGHKIVVQRSQTNRLVPAGRLLILSSTREAAVIASTPHPARGWPTRSLSLPRRSPSDEFATTGLVFGFRPLRWSPDLACRFVVSLRGSYPAREQNRRSLGRRSSSSTSPCRHWTNAEDEEDRAPVLREISRFQQQVPLFGRWCSKSSRRAPGAALFRVAFREAPLPGSSNSRGGGPKKCPAASDGRLLLAHAGGRCGIVNRDSITHEKTG